MDDKEQMRVLRGLEEGTDWEYDGDMLAVNDPEDEDDGMGGVRVLDPGPDGSGSLGAEGESVLDILSCVNDMVANGDVADVLFVVNLVDDEQVCFTTLDRNDLILGTFETAKLNWHATQVALQNYEEEYDDE